MGDDPTTQVCAGVSPNFCITAGIAVTAPGTSTDERRAAAPFDVSVSLANSSPSHDTTDTSRWLDTIGLTFLTAPGNTPLLTPSSHLPNGLLVAGSTTTCPSDSGFAGCTAGQGTALLNITGSGFFDGEHTSTFGIQHVTNVNPTTVAGAVEEYDVLVTLCVPSPVGPCTSEQNVDLTLSVGRPGGSDQPEITFPVSGDTSVSGIGVHYSLDTLALNLHGRSNQLDTGPADRTYTALRLPARCGTVHGDVRATDTANDSVLLAQPITLLGCPTVSALSASGIAPYRAAFTATAAGAGRPVTHYRWTFGDGTHATTKSRTVKHTYRNSRTRRVTVTAVDSAGALSRTRGVTLAGSRLTLAAPKKAAKGSRISLSGVLTKGKKRLGGRHLILSGCSATGHHCHVIARPTTRSGGGHVGTYVLHVTLLRATKYQVAFNGGPRQLGARAARTAHVTG